MREAKSEYYVRFPFPPLTHRVILCGNPPRLKVIDAGGSDGAHSSVRFREVVKL